MYTSLLSQVSQTFTCVNPTISYVTDKRWPPKPVNTLRGWFMVSTCHPQWGSNSDSQAVRSACEYITIDASINSTMSLMPVTTGGVSFRNVFCAFCNFQSNVSTYMYWSPQLRCDYGRDVNGTEELKQTAADYCKLEDFNRPNRSSLEPANGLDPLRPCLVVEEAKCRPFDQLAHQIVNFTKAQYSCLEQRCKNDFRETYVYVDEAKGYRNRYCASCSEPFSYMLCQKYMSMNMPPPPPPPTSFVLLMDFRSTGSVMMTSTEIQSIIISTSCPRGQVYDPHRQHCRSIICLANPEQTGSECSSISRADQTAGGFGLLGIQFHTPHNTQVKSGQSEQQKEQVISLFVKLIARVSSNTLKELWSSNSSLKEAVIHTVVTTLEMHQAVNISVSAWIHSRTVSVNATATLHNATSNVTISKLKHSLSVALDILVTLSSNPSRFLSDIEKDLYHLNCSQMVSLNASEFTLFANGSAVEHAAAGMLSSDQFVILTDGRMVRCSNYSRNYTLTIEEIVEVWDYDSPIIIISMTGSVLNIISAALVFFIYLCLKSLRTLPAINLVNLVATIFMSHLLLITAANQVHNASLCTATAVCLHYFFLCSFTWSTVMAYDMMQTFVFERRQVDSKCHTLMRYCAFAWGLPLLICSLCLLLDLTHTLSIGYGSSRMCWLSNKTALLVVFVVPIAISMTFNLIAFIATSRSIHVTMSRSRSIRSIRGTMKKKASSTALSQPKQLSSKDINIDPTRKCSNTSTSSDTPIMDLSAPKSNSAFIKPDPERNVRREVIILASLFSLLSLTWLFALLAAIEETDFFWYPFSVCTALQGLAILVFYVIKKRVKDGILDVVRKISPCSRKPSAMYQVEMKNRGIVKAASTQPPQTVDVNAA